MRENVLGLRAVLALSLSLRLTLTLTLALTLTLPLPLPLTPTPHQVRVLCFRGEHAKAAALVTESGDLAGAYHLAKQYEAQEDIREAVQYFQLAKRYNHASRLARAHGLTGELSSLALQAPPKMMAESAAYFEERNMPAQAVELYQKAGNTSRAIDLCFRHRLFDR